MGAFRAALTWTFRRIVGVYFREIEIAGDVPQRDVGGRLFVSNHVNGLVDPILVLTTVPCDISPVAKSTLWSVPGLKWLLSAVDAVPIVRRRDDPTKGEGSNDAVFDAVAAWLRRGGNILIFPEGTSHSEPHLAQLKTGAGRMWLRARDKEGVPLTLQAVAIEFDAREKFRSRALLVHGPVRRIEDFEGEGDDFVAAVTEQIRKDLSELLVEGATWDERRLIARVAEIFAHEEGDVSLAGWSAIGRQVEAAKRALSGSADVVEKVASAVSLYYAQLDRAGLTDAEVKGIEEPTVAGPIRKALLAVSAPIAAIGAVLFAPPYLATELIADQVKSPDEIATYKLGAGLALHPLWAAILMGASIAFLPKPWNAAAAALVGVAPFAALLWRDATPDLRRKLRAGLRRGDLALARARREEVIRLLREIQAALATNAPDPMPPG